MAQVLHVRVVEGKDLMVADVNGLSDPYLRLKLGRQKLKSEVHKGTLNPLFNADFSFPLTGASDEKDLRIKVVDYDSIGADDPMGEYSLSLSVIRASPKQRMAGWRPVTHKHKPFAGHIYVAAVLANKDDDGAALLDEAVADQAKEEALVMAASQASLQALAEEKQEDKEQEQKEEKERAVDGKTLSLFVGTWNVGNKPPPSGEELREWITPGYDLYAIGVQECQYDGEGMGHNSNDHWNNTLADCLAGYVAVRHNHLMQIRLAVFAKKTISERIHSVMVGREATGLADVIGNKGGVVIRLVVDDLSLAFVSCHLAAHQHKKLQRNADLRSIFKSVTLGSKSADLGSQHHHVFVMGDLNYRVDYGGQGDEPSPTQEQFDNMVALIEADKHAELAPFDQLRAEIANGHALHQFQEGDFTRFKPTFKVQRQAKLQYNPQRSPAWTDRVLWRSLLPSRLVNTSYQAANTIATSDHKPVSATFALLPLRVPCAVIKRSQPTPTLHLRQLELSGLKSVRSSDHIHVKLSGCILSDSEATQSVQQSADGTLKWEQGVSLRFKASNKARLAVASLLLRLLEDGTAGTSLLGSCGLNVKDALDSSPANPFKFDLPIIHGGLAVGHVKGEMSMSWD